MLQKRPWNLKMLVSGTSLIVGVLLIGGALMLSSCCMLHMPGRFKAKDGEGAQKSCHKTEATDHSGKHE